MSIHRSPDKLTRLTVAQYNGEARPGELVVDSETYQLYIGNGQGNLNLVAGSGVPGGPNSSVQYNLDGDLAGSSALSFDGTNLNLTGTLNVEAGINSPTGHLQIGTVGSNGSASFGNVSVGAYLETDDLEVDGTAHINNLTVTGEANLGSVTNLSILGGANGQTLTTDGTGNLSWRNGSGTGVTLINTANGIVGGPITESGTIGLAYTGVVPGTYELSTITVDTYGRVMAAVPTTNANLPGNLAVEGTLQAGNTDVEFLAVNDGASVSGNVSIDGNLLVTGNITSTSANIIVIDDLYILLANGAPNAAAASGAGLRIAGANANITYDSTSNSIQFNNNISLINGASLVFSDDTEQTSAYPGTEFAFEIANLTVTQDANLGQVENVEIFGGTAGQVLTTDGAGNLSWSDSTATPAGSNNQIQFNVDDSFGASSDLTYDPDTSTLNVPIVSTESITATGAVTVGSLSVAGGITAAANLNIGDATVIAGNAVIDAGVTADAVYATTLEAEYANLGSATNLTITGGAAGQVLTTDGTGNVRWQDSPSGTGAVFVTSNVASIVAGSSLQFAVDYSNPTYPGGVFTLYQTAAEALVVSGAWATGGSNKNAYANYAAGQVNTQNVNVTLSLSGGSTFDVQSTDNITIGSTVITGAELIALGIGDTGGTYTISGTDVVPAQTANSSIVTASLTTTSGVKTGSGAPLTTTAPIPFAVTGLSGSFPQSDIPFWEPNQSFSWAATVTGVVSSGNVVLSGSQSANLTTSGALSGNSSSYNSTVGPFTITASYTGAGLYGAGTTTVSGVTANVAVADPIEPLLWKYTMSNANPNFTTSDNHLNTAFAVGQGAMSSSNVNQYLWLAIPADVTPQPGFTYNTPLGPARVTTTDVYTNVSISGSTYNLYGFNEFNASVFLETYTI